MIKLRLSKLPGSAVTTLPPLGACRVYIAEMREALSVFGRRKLRQRMGSGYSLLRSCCGREKDEERRDGGDEFHQDSTGYGQAGLIFVVVFINVVVVIGAVVVLVHHFQDGFVIRRIVHELLETLQVGALLQP